MEGYFVSFWDVCAKPIISKIEFERAEIDSYTEY